jgi:hypothetical protein
VAIRHSIKPRYKTRNEEIVAGLRATAGADAPRDPVMMIKKKTADLAYLMALVHGGDWRVQIENDLLLVARRRPRRQRSR